MEEQASSISLMDSVLRLTLLLHTGLVFVRICVTQKTTTAEQQLYNQDDDSS